MQPISGAVINAMPAWGFLSAEPPNLEEVRRALDRIAADGTHASDVIAKLRALSKKAPQQKDSLEVNDTIRDVIALIAGRSDEERRLGADAPRGGPAARFKAIESNCSKSFSTCSSTPSKR